MKHRSRFPRWLLVLGVLAGVLAVAGGSGGSQAAPAGATFGPNVRLNQVTTDQQQEPTLAINPTNPQMIIAAAKDWREGRKEVWHYHSTDGGATWADVHIPGLPADLPNQSDPVVLYNADGVAYTVVIGYNQDEFDQGDSSKGGLYVSHSTDNGATWSNAVAATTNSATVFNDKEWMVMDRSSTATRGTLYITWTRFTTPPHGAERGDIMEIRSTDGGATWSAPVQVSDPANQSDVQGSFPAVGPSGDLNVVYFDETRAQSLWVARSSNGGKSFAPPVKAAAARRPPSPLPTSQFRTFVLPTLAVNPKDDSLVATWNDYASGKSEIELVTSRDGNHMWSAPVRVNQDTAPVDHFFPTAAFGPDGLLHLAWLDRRDDPHNLTFSAYYTQSTDDGATFAPNVRIADAQSDPSVGFGGTLIGDYIALDAWGGKAWVAWIDTRNGTQDIYGTSITGRLPAAPAPSPSPAAPTGTPGPGATPPPAPSATPGASATATPVAGGNFADPAFARVWARADDPVQRGLAARPWLWGPAPFAAGNEPYQQGPNGQRLVQYFDKSRMEINNPAADPTQPWYVTNGLLVVEMMTGHVQVGDNQFDSLAYQPNPVPVAGDMNSPDAPTYATLALVASLHADHKSADATGQVVNATIDHTGTVTPSAPPIAAASQVVNAQYDAALAHNIPNVFWTFLNQQGPVEQNGQIVQGAVIDPLAAFGHPLTEAYWARLRIAGQDHWALIQAFQRRVLTYVPDNAPPWQVEMGNVGRHYYDWRYGPHSPYADLRGDEADER